MTEMFPSRYDIWINLQLSEDRLASEKTSSSRYPQNQAPLNNCLPALPRTSRVPTDLKEPITTWKTPEE
ncbi:hypothetical protein ILYODFUR_019744 [Ilyodon furcidens]|uniref:Uncharacterized protein n=1 Tax=Ilyodon furcidens TaxID=33524 RepID=A0ABV0U7F2_9TELE